MFETWSDGGWRRAVATGQTRLDGTCEVAIAGLAGSRVEWIGADRLRRPPPGSAAAAALCLQGRAVEIEWHGLWYPGRVLRGPRTDGRCYVTYTGWPDTWNEWVEPQRLR